MARYSYSRLNGFDQCPKKFLWRYVWNVTPPVEGVEAFVGKRVHESLESLYAGRIRGEAAPDLQVILEGYSTSWERGWSDAVRIVAAHDAEHYRRIGSECLASYYHRHHPFDAGTTVGVEQGFEFPVDGSGRHQLRGFIDRIDIAPDGAVEVHDYKTSGRTATREALEKDLQVGLYELAARRMFPEHRRVRLVWHYLRAGVEQRLPARGPAEMAELRRSTAARIDAIEARTATYETALDADGRRSLAASRRASPSSVPLAARGAASTFPPRVSPLCRWCSFLNWCPEGSEFAGLPFNPPAPAPAPPPRPGASTPGGQLPLF